MRVTDFQRRNFGEGFRSLGTYRLFFAAALREELAARRAYDEEVRDWYENGDGRPAEWVTEVSCGNCGDALTQGRPPFQTADAWYSPGANGRFCPEVDGRDHEPAFRKVNIGGLGHRFPRCIHGENLWVDHDIPCGWCEEGETAIEIARVRARERFLRFNGRWDWLCQAPVDLPISVRREIEQWTISLFPGRES